MRVFLKIEKCQNVFTETDIKHSILNRTEQIQSSEMEKIQFISQISGQIEQFSAFFLWFEHRAELKLPFIVTNVVSRCSPFPPHLFHPVPQGFWWTSHIHVLNSERYVRE